MLNKSCVGFIKKKFMNIRITLMFIFKWNFYSTYKSMQIVKLIVMFSLLKGIKALIKLQ